MSEFNNIVSALLTWDSQLFLVIKAAPDTPTLLIMSAIALARLPIYFIPCYLMWLWLKRSTHLSCAALLRITPERVWALRLLATLLLSVLMNFCLGVLWDRPRPFLVAEMGEAWISHRASPSFPSNHAAILAGYAVCLWQRRHNWLAKLWIVLTLLVSLARVYLGVHYPLDVIAGWLLGGSMAYLVCKCRRRKGAPLCGVG